MLKFKMSFLATAVISGSLCLTACGGGSSDNNNSAITPNQSVQTAVLSGKVLNKDTNKPIENATIIVGDNKITTDKDGNYNLANLATGTATITISATGYTTQSLTKNLVSNTNTLDIILVPVAVTNPTTPTTKQNLLGKDLASQYQGTYSLSCKKIALNSTPETKMLSIDSSGKLVFDGNTLFDNSNGIAGVMIKGDNVGMDSIMATNSTNPNYNTLSITDNNSVTVLNNSATNNYLCEGTTISANYFGKNAAKIIRNRIANKTNVECRDGLLNPSTFKTTISMRNDNSIVVGDKVYAGSNFAKSDFGFTILTGIDEYSKNKIASYDYTLRNDDEEAGKGLKIFLDANENFKSLYLDTPDMSQPRTCEVLN